MAEEEAPPAAPAVPHVSFNHSITPPEAFGPPPSPAQIKAMKAAKPKLSGAWSIWEQYKAESNKAKFADTLKEIVTFDTVTKFWACWNHMPQPSELLNGKQFVRNDQIVESVMLFRKGVRPEWEDKENNWGGHFELKMEPKLGGAVIDEVWNNLVLGMISGGIENSDMLTGIRLVDKLSAKGAKSIIRIELWFNDNTEEAEPRRYKLRGSFEEIMAMKWDGQTRPRTWQNTNLVTHIKDEKKR